MNQGCVLALAGRASDAIEMLISGIAARRTTGATLWMPFYLPHLARAHAELGQFEEAWRCIGEAMTAAETTKETWCEAEIHRTAGEITLMSPEPDAAKAQAHFERALAIAREQQAKSWELRAATSMARLWRGQGKRQQARDLLAPIYGWFTEGFDTLDLKQAKALLDDLAAMRAPVVDTSIGSAEIHPRRRTTACSRRYPTMRGRPAPGLRRRWPTEVRLWVSAEASSQCGGPLRQIFRQRGPASPGQIRA